MENVDEDLYSRQLYVIGDTAMKNIASASVILHGLGGVGAEIAKNLVLMGVQHLAICDENTVDISDLGRNCFLTMEDVNSSRNRAEATCKALQEMNSYVTVSVVDSLIFSETQVPKLHQYQVVILTEFDLDAAVHLDNICRNQSPPIKVILADVFGIMSWMFCDFSNSFDVYDPDGEEEKEVLVGNITLTNSYVVSTADDSSHFLETDDSILLTDVIGIDGLNDSVYKVKVLNQTSFTLEGPIPDTVSGVYERGGRFKKMKEPLHLSFESLESQLLKASTMDIDLNKNMMSQNIHVAFLAVHEFKKQEHRLPNVRCAADADTFVSLAKSRNKRLDNPVQELNEVFLRQVSYTAAGELPPLCAFLGGVVSQEVVKAVTGKFTPLKQWLHFDVAELTVDAQDDAPVTSFLARGDRYDKLRACIGDACLTQLGNASLFMVGCGAIGCEMLKNYSLLGVAVQGGKVTVTDHDLIEKSNLSRQFLFRNHHVQQSKSVVAATACSFINPDLKIESHQNKVGVESENIYNHNFMKAQDVIVNALDNVETRRYMDRRCVQSSRPLLDSGTMGCKGHVQVVLPHLTETYSAQSDPVEQEYPVCTIKSFPSHFEHTVQWAREKFQSYLDHKLKVFDTFWKTHRSVDNVLQCLSTHGKVQYLWLVLNILKNRPSSFQDCVCFARQKFQKYFNHKAEQLLASFPLNTVLKDGSLFWHSPRQPPKPIAFDENDDMCLTFVTSFAKLLANGFGIKYSPQESCPEVIKEFACRSYIPVFQPQKSKVIITDPLVKNVEDNLQLENPEVMAQELKRLSKQFPIDGIKVFPQVFDKDKDLHIQLVTSASNLRARMYGLQPRSSLQVKLIAGRIIPAIASTTSAISGLVAIELIKVIKKMKERESYRNWFVNLALNSFLTTEPASPIAHEMRPGLSHSVWDHWEVPITLQTTLQEVLHKLKEMSDLKPNMVLQGTKIVWIPLLPNQNKKLKQPISLLVNKSPVENFVEVSVTFETSGEDCIGPPIWLMLQ